MLLSGHQLKTIFTRWTFLALGTIYLLVNGSVQAKPPYQVVAYAYNTNEASATNINDGSGPAINWTSDVPWSDITVVADAFYKPTTSDTFTSAGAKGSVLINAAHTAGVRCIVSLGGEGQDGAFKTLCASAGSISAFASAVTAFVATNGYDGVDIDWETVNQPSTTQASNMLIGLYTALKALPNCSVDGNPHTLSFTTNPTYSAIYNFSTLGTATDWCLFMGYDWYDNPTTYANGPLNGVSPSIVSSITSITANYPIGKMVLGCPLYTNDYNAGTEDDTLSILHLGTAGTYNTSYAEQDYTAPDGNTVYVDTAQSYCDKINWMHGAGLMGIGMWDMGQGLPYTDTDMAPIWSVIGGNSACLTFVGGATSTMTQTSTSTPPPNTATQTHTMTATNTNTVPANTATSTQTQTNTKTPVPNTATSTVTQTHTDTAPANTATSTATQSNTSTPLAETATSTSTLTSSMTPTSTQTQAATNTQTNTITPLADTATETSTMTMTHTPTLGNTNTLTSTNTPLANTATQTSTATNINTSTSTLTSTFTSIFTATSTTTSTATQTSTYTAKFTFTPTSTSTLTCTYTATLALTYCAGVPAWSGNSVVYHSGQVVGYNGEQYQCIQSHMSEPNWMPPATPALWQDMGPCGSTPTSVVGTGTPVIYPNPVTGSSALLQLPTANATNVKVQIFTIAFREVQTLKFAQVSGSQLTIPVMDRSGMMLADGLYYFVIQANGIRWIDKVLVLR